MAARTQLLQAAASNPKLAGVRANGQEDTPQFRLDIDQPKASALGVAIADINETLAISWGGRYIDDFVDRNRVKRVLKEAFWSQVDKDTLEEDIVIVARPGVGEVIETEGLAGAERCVREVLDLESGKGGKRST